MDIEQAKQEIKRRLPDYINDTGRKINRSGNFGCFNASAHSHGDKTPSAGIVPGSDDKGWKCFGCGAAGDIFTAVKLEEGKEFNEALEYLSNKYSINIDKNNKQSRPIHNNNIPVTKASTADKVKKYDFTELINELHQNVTYTDYFKKRGFSEELINKYKLGFSPKGYNEALKNFKELNNWMKDAELHKYIIPILNMDGSCNYFIARRTDDKKPKTLNMKKEAGGIRIFNDRYLKDSSLTGKFIFITEGWADTLSFEEFGYSSIAINGTSNVDIFLKLVKINLNNLKNKIFVIAGDTDNPGQNASKALKEGLKALKLSIKAFRIPSPHKDSNDYLQADREGFRRDLELFKSSIVNEDFTATYIESFINEIEKNRENKAISTGFNALDKKLGGGLYAGLYCVGAISSLGKTAFILQICDYIASQGKDVLFFSLEMSKFEVVSRSLSKEMFKIDSSPGRMKSVGTRDVMNGYFNFELMATAMNQYEIAGQHMAVIEGAFDTGVSEIRRRIEKNINLRGIRPVVVVDYLQILKPIDVRMSDKQNMDYAVTELKRISRDYDIPVIAISSFNRMNYTSPVSFESFKESGAVEYTADVLIGLQLSGIHDLPPGNGKENERKEKLNELKAADPRGLELVILKNRNGVPYATHEYDFYPKFNYFEEKV